MPAPAGAVVAAVNQSTYTLCNAGQTSDAGEVTGVCTNCPAGKDMISLIFSPLFHMAFSTPRSVVISGTYTDVPGMPACIPCPPGHFAVGPGATSCTACSAGSAVAWDLANNYQTWDVQVPVLAYYANFTTTACVACPAGYHQPVPGSATCLPCKPGFYTAASECHANSSFMLMNSCTTSLQYPPTSTDQGYLSAVTTGACAVSHPSPASLFIVMLPAANSATCTQCLVGETSTSASTVCTPCPVGTYADAQAMGICRPCSAGWYAPTTGMSVCTQCPAGEYSYAGASACLQCPKGTITPFPGTARCSYCSKGQYANAVIGASACLSCPAGKFSNACEFV